jgi:hypothetical protein
MGVNEGMLPTPKAGKPIAGLLFVHTVLGGTTIGDVVTPSHTFILDKKFELHGIVKGTVNGNIPQPSVVKTVFPLIIVKEIGTPQGNPK